MKTKFWKFKQINNSADTAELLLYGPISESSWRDDAVSSKQFADDLKALGNIKQLDIRINSPGGDVFAAQAIYSMLKRHSANKTVYIDGLAASAATIVAMAGNLIIMPKNALFMIHNPWTFTGGNSIELRELADFLDKVRETIISVYEEKTGKNSDEIIKLMDEETWMTANEALDLGFVDEIERELALSASIREDKLCLNGVEMDISIFKNFKTGLLIENNPKNNGDQKNSSPKNDVKDDIKDKTEEKDLKNATKETILQENPALVAEIKKEAMNEERQRIKAIDELGIKGNDELIIKAKYEDGLTVEQVSHQILLAEKKQRSTLSNDIKDDAAILNAVSSSDSSNKPDRSEEIALKIAEGANAKRK